MLSFHKPKVLKSLLGAFASRHSDVETKWVSMDHLLCGGENGIPADQYARQTGDFLRPSTPISRSPHVQFLEQYLRIGEEIFRPEIFRQTAYFANAVECIDICGQYFVYSHEDQVEQIARNFIAQFRNGRQSNGLQQESSPFSSPDSLPEVHRINHSACYQLEDGNHRLAIAYVRGEKGYMVKVLPPAVLTPLQKLLLDVVACYGRREIFQPIESPELGDKWRLLRPCDKWFEVIEKFLREHELLPPRLTTYMDIGCSYGWFVRAFGQLGFEAHGVEIDRAAVQIGQCVYGLQPEQVMRIEPSRFLRSNPKPYDITSCFNLLHDYVLGHASCTAEEMLKLIDSATGTALFMNMGQSHKTWERIPLTGWSADRIEQWLRDNSSFAKIHRLVAENVKPSENDYDNTIFACLRR